MTLKTFNIDEKVVTEFSKRYKGDMSKIVENLITNYLDLKSASSEDIVKIKNELDQIEGQIKELKEKRSNLVLILAQAQEQQEEEEKAQVEVNYKREEWIRNYIADAKDQGRYTDLVYDSEKKNFATVEAYLKDMWDKQVTE